MVGLAVRAPHGDPAAAWTVPALARTAGLSCAASSAASQLRWAEPPPTYLTGWRIAQAKQALHRDGSTLAAVAGEVGYASEFALSAAFRQAVGEAPGRWRERTRST